MQAQSNLYTTSINQMSVRTPEMARAAQTTPRRPRDVLSAGSLLQNSSLQPVIASRSGGDRSKDADESAHLSHVQYMTHARSDISTPLNMYDVEDTSTIASSYASPTVDDFLNNDGRGYHQEAAVVPYGTYPRTRGYGYGGRPPGRRGHLRPVMYRERMRLTAPICYIVLKVLELIACITIVILSRMFYKDLTLDYVYTIFAGVALVVAGVGLLVVWVRGHPVPDDFGHTMMLLMYSVAVPVLLCGGLLVLLLSDLNQSVIAVATLFFVTTVLFTFDIMVMASALLECDSCCCCCCFIPPDPPRRIHRVYPNTYPVIHHDPYYYYCRHPYPYRPHRYPYPTYYPRRNGYPAHLRTIPEMSVWTPR